MMPSLSAFTPGEDRPAGYVFRLPPDAIRGNDGKARPHFLLHRCTGGAGWGTLSHMTSQGDDTGGVTYEIRELRGRMRLRSQRGSYVLASRLVPWPAEMLVEPSEAHGKHLNGVRASVRRALGSGSGVAPHGGRSLRGWLVRIDPGVATRLSAQFGVVVTQHEYSARRAFQTIIPLVDRSSYEPTHQDVILPESAPWHRCLPDDWAGAPVALLPLAISLSHGGGAYRKQIDRVLPESISEKELNQIETALMSRLGC